MDVKTDYLKRSDVVSLKLRSLYEQHGYIKYRMNKFEEYGYYLENKNFLGNDSYITFNDKNGKLMALKPDVTLSIVKNVKKDAGANQRVYYSENIYRRVKNAAEFREISQTGLEFIGSIDTVTTVEVLLLALKSLEIIDSSFVLTVSHMGILSGLMESIDADYTVKNKILECIKRKSAHDAARVCRDSGISEEAQRRIEGIIGIGGKLCDAADSLKELSCNETMSEAAAELARIGEFFAASKYNSRVMLDFDTVSDMKYYNGIMFCGYIEGVASSVLVGGRYDNLLKKMDKENLQAMGFAVNFYELDRFLRDNDESKADAVVLYGKDTDPVAVAAKVDELCDKGLKVICEKELPVGIKYDSVIDLRN